ncbi:hypothetical protein L9F63_001169 [Diploptera punctata]|uniref:Small integral membrane protein 14 n=1 Tax=Diploptera punctata TaxID=6984 RepID=A0AAD8EJ87_DIPPU|nr:hypothetical protein L9F63_001169 [Diploptera punctata]
MGDDGFDPCECIWSHEMAMRRLLSLLRQSQAYCTDTECFEELPGNLPSPRGIENSFFIMALCWIAFALILFFMRPNSLQARDDVKPRDNEFGPRGTPPAPPPALN